MRASIINLDEWLDGPLLQLVGWRELFIYDAWQPRLGYVENECTHHWGGRSGGPPRGGRWLPCPMPLGRLHCAMLVSSPSTVDALLLQ